MDCIDRDFISDKIEQEFNISKKCPFFMDCLKKLTYNEYSNLCVNGMWLYWCNNKMIKKLRNNTMKSPKEWEIKENSIAIAEDL